MINKIFYFLVLVFCIGIVQTAKADAPLCGPSSKSCFCMADSACIDHPIGSPTDVTTYQADCTNVQQSSYPLYDGKCGNFTGHCNCKPNCIAYPYTNGSQLKQNIANCKAATCQASDPTFLAGPCPAATTASTDNGGKSVSLDNPLGFGNNTDIKVILASIITKVLQIMGGLSLMMILYGSTGWIQSGGNPEKIESGKKTIMWAVLGVILTLFSYIILNGIFKAYF